MPGTMRTPAAIAAALALLSVPTASASPSRFSLVQLRAGAACTAATEVAAAGGALVAAELALWRVPTARVAGLAPRLRAQKALRLVQPDRKAGSFDVTPITDPLAAGEWWRPVVGADQVEPPGPGRTVTVVDSGVDLFHPEFAGRPGTVALNAQTTGPGTAAHGTAVASLVGAPANGTGMVGIYPQAVIQSYDAAPGRELDTSEIVAGILAAAHGGPGVINLSLGSRSREPLIEQAVDVAYGSGSLIVAAAGNERQDGNPLEYPAALPHVLTVAATDRTGQAAFFSNASPKNDLAAPGVEMTIAVPGGSYTDRGAGTSFASPLVAGAAAWVWTVRPKLDNTQLFEVMRRSATDVGTPGVDEATGFGILNVPGALTYPAPGRDPKEPNDDVEFVSPQGFFAASATSAPLTGPGKERLSIYARLDANEDRHDLYRVWVPARKDLIATARQLDADVDLSAWRVTTSSIQQAPAGLRLAQSTHRGLTTESVVVRNTATRDSFVYLDLTLAPGTPSGSYVLGVSTKPLPKPVRKTAAARR